MKPQTRQVFKKSALFLALSSALTLPQHAFSAEAETETVTGIERIQVTASRRISTVQDAPFNITALDGDVMQDQNIGKLSEVGRWVPGLTVLDQGGIGGNSIIVRGLSTGPVGLFSDGGTVATYFGEIPLDADIRLIDMERVEVLIGPQGTLYGAGTLGGAIRYMPNKAEVDVSSFSLSGDTFKGRESDNFGGEISFIANAALIENVLAIRASVNYYNDPGFIDYAYTVKQGGVSNPDPDWTDPQDVSDNIRSVEDANGQEVLTRRIAVRLTPNDWLDGTLTYLHQQTNIEGNSVVHYQSLHEDNSLQPLVGKYESALRYLEPEENKDSLISLDLAADLGFAELVSATGYAKKNTIGQRDHTDYLISRPWSYEDSPNFSAFTRDTIKTKSFTQELRLISQSESAFSWIFGGYYNKTSFDSLSAEYTPEFAYSNRDDDLEYLLMWDDTTEEKALFGELSYLLMNKLTLTVGARFYKYDIDTDAASASPFLGDIINDSLVFDGDVIERYSSNGDGHLFKANVSYQFNDDVMSYITVSEGFRLGGSNNLPACPSTVDKTDSCALPHEISYQPDTTTNYELGFKSTWLDNQLHFNAAIFYVDWQDAQVDGGSTVNGGNGYKTNAGSAESKGIEISLRAMITENLTAFAAFSHAKAKLTEDVDGLFQRISHPDDAGYNDDPDSDDVYFTGMYTDHYGEEQGLENLASLKTYYSGADGDRLSGAPETQFSLGVNYSREILGDKLLAVVYGLTYQSDMLTTVGQKAYGETLAGYALSNLSATISDEAWSVTFYVDNLFDKYAFTSTQKTYQAIGGKEDTYPLDISNPNTIEQYRAYGHYVTSPRTIGLKFNYLFDI